MAPPMPCITLPFSHACWWDGGMDNQLGLGMCDWYGTGLGDGHMGEGSMNPFDASSGSCPFHAQRGVVWRTAWATTRRHPFQKSLTGVSTALVLLFCKSFLFLPVQFLGIFTVAFLSGFWYFSLCFRCVSEVPPPPKLYLLPLTHTEFSSIFFASLLVASPTSTLAHC